jgi:hypothetical protein
MFGNKIFHDFKGMLKFLYFLALGFLYLSSLLLSKNIFAQGIYLDWQDKPYPPEIQRHLRAAQSATDTLRIIYDFSNFCQSNINLSKKRIGEIESKLTLFKCLDKTKKLQENTLNSLKLFLSEKSSSDDNFATLINLINEWKSNNQLEADNSQVLELLSTLNNLNSIQTLSNNEKAQITKFVKELLALSDSTPMTELINECVRQKEVELSEIAKNEVQISFNKNEIDKIEANRPLAFVPKNDESSISSNNNELRGDDRERR